MVSINRGRQVGPQYVTIIALGLPCDKPPYGFRVPKMRKMPQQSQRNQATHPMTSSAAGSRAHAAPSIVYEGQERLPEVIEGRIMDYLHILSHIRVF